MSEKEKDIETIQEMSMSYRIYLLSRRDFLSGVLIGVASSFTISYITQLDVAFSGEMFTVYSIVIRVLISGGLLGYLLYSHRKRTKVYENLLKNMSELIQKKKSESVLE